MRKFIVAIMAILLVGCATSQPPIKETEVRYEKIPKDLTSPCLPEIPKKKEDYLALKPHEREAYLADYSVSLLGTVKDCNIKLDKINKLNAQLK